MPAQLSSRPWARVLPSRRAVRGGTRLPGETAGVPRRGMPTRMTWAASLVEEQLRDDRRLIGSRQRFDHGPATELLGRPLRPVANAVEATARSLLDRDLVQSRDHGSHSAA